MYCNIQKLCTATFQAVVLQHCKINHEHMEKWKQLNNHISALQHLKKVISTLKIPYCNNSNIRTPFLQHINHPIATFENHLLQQHKNPVATRRKQQKMYKQ